MNLHPIVIKTNIENTTLSACYGKRRKNKGIGVAATVLSFVAGFILFQLFLHTL